MNSDSVLYQLSHNRAAAAAFTAWFTAQAIKVILGLVRTNRFDFRWLARSGGMPSSHVALSLCLATSTGLYYGFNAPVFALALGFGIITMFDAQGVRRHSGKQAEILNKILEDIYEHKGVQENRLKEFIGHTPVEVYTGGVLGILIAILFYRGPA